MRVRKRSNESAVGLCERCGQVCGPGCRRSALRERVLLHELWLGVRV